MFDPGKENVIQVSLMPLLQVLPERHKISVEFRILHQPDSKGGFSSLRVSIMEGQMSIMTTADIILVRIDNKPPTPAG